MISADERSALKLWFEAFEPAADVELTPESVLIWSTRPNRNHDVVRCGRTSDLHQDLNSALSMLVDSIS